MKCPTCKGEGWRYLYKDYFSPPESKICAMCGGTGNIPNKKLKLTKKR